jgi:7-cyano-7-deazaguanine reductase
MLVGSTNDLKPESLICVRRTDFGSLFGFSGAPPGEQEALSASPPHRVKKRRAMITSSASFLAAFARRSPMPTRPRQRLQTFRNPAPGRDYRIQMETAEFTCLCPLTGQPDFATLQLEYVPEALCIELKSLKLYLWGYRDQGAFHEAVTNRILDDLVRAARPRFMRLSARFNVRGGIHTTVIAEHRKRGWKE